MVKRNPFDFVKSVSQTKIDLMVDEVEEKAYQPFLINKALSYHQDSVFFTNEMNIRHGVDNRLQYVFFLNTLRKRQRFSKWSKPYISKKLDVIKKHYQVSTKIAKEYVELLTDKQMKELKKTMNLGGINE
ncbi:uncharacterized protein METZ01_LOCUS487619 [marine metagenome]|uniref:DNA polymerase n=1 Tax=marine metagenome TaxID=408172 RepID=A0A383CSC7_9ZZZZ